MIQHILVCIEYIPEYWCVLTTYQNVLNTYQKYIPKLEYTHQYMPIQKKSIALYWVTILVTALTYRTHVPAEELANRQQGSCPDSKSLNRASCEVEAIPGQGH